MRTITLQEPGRFVSGTDDIRMPAAGEALVRIHRIGICGTDLHAFDGQQPFFSYPRILGHELGAEIIEVPAGGHGLHRGDRCAIEPYLSCGRCRVCRLGRYNCCEDLKVLGVHTDGGMRGLMTVPIERLHRSSRLTFEQWIGAADGLASSLAANGVGKGDVVAIALPPSIDYARVIGLRTDALF